MATGDNLIIGRGNDSSSTTVLTYSEPQVRAFTAFAFQAINEGKLAPFPIAGARSIKAGLYGLSRFDIGVLGEGGGVGLLGQASAANAIPIVAKGIAGQTGDLQQWQDGDGKVLSVVDKEGRFGIGTDDPQAILHVVGRQRDFRFADPANLAFNLNDPRSGMIIGQLDWQTPSSSQFPFRLASIAAEVVGNMIHAPNLGGTLRFFTKEDFGATEERMRIDSDGRVTVAKTLNVTDSILTNGTVRLTGAGSLLNVTADAGIITSGLLSLARGGVGTDLSKTGALACYLKQKGLGLPISVEPIQASELPRHTHGASDISTGILDLDRIPATLTRKDADTVDGSHASSFAASTHTHAASDLPASVVYTDKANSFGASNQSFDGGTLVVDAINHRVGIGTNAPERRLHVKGDIRVEDGGISIKDWSITVPDYVFKEDYRLQELADLEEYVTETHHLPEIPSANELARDGIDVGEFCILLLKKIEELSLYAIHQDRVIKDLNARLSKLEDQNPDTPSGFASCQTSLSSR